MYWAEGSKSKPHSPSVGVVFSNSDSVMIKIYLRWLREVLKIADERIDFEIFIHESHRGSTEEIRNYWSKVTGFSISGFGKIYFKKNKIRTKRKNVGDRYKGLLRIKVKKSTNLNRRIEGLIEGVCIQCGVV